MAVPLLSPLVAEEETKITQRTGGAPESSKPSWASPTITHSLQDTPPGPGEAGRCPASQDQGHSGAHLLTRPLWCQEQKLLIGESTAMRYFFLFVLLDNLVTSSLSYRVSRSSTIMSLPLPSRPLPTPEPSKFPLAHTPPCTAPPTRGRQAALRWAPGPDQGGLPPCGQASVPFAVLFSANTRTEREARISSQTDTKQRQRDSDLEAGHQKDGVGVGGCPRGRGPYMDGTKCPVTLSRLGRMFSWVAFTRTRAGGGSRLSPSHCP